MLEGKRDQEIENIFENTVTENFPNLVKEIDIQIQEVQRVPNKINPKRSTARHMIMKMPKVKDKERILKATREKQLVTYKGADFFIETLKTRRDWQEIFKVMKNKDLQPKLLYPVKQIKGFPDKKSSSPTNQYYMKC